MTLMMPNQQIDSLPPVKDDVVLSVQGVSKKFCRDLKRSLMYGVSDISQEMLGLRGEKNTTLRKKEFWALQDVSFELRRGEALGLVGKNGSGKSTLLRVIAGLIKPDVGTVQVKGRVAPLIALGAGFNPILTGRENIYANMSILGLSKAEIDERFDEVTEFAEIGEAIDSPVQNYSSGMAARLGFASAIYTEPDILLLDEVLAVGDAKFQAKCYRRLHELKQRGTVFILVSHYPQLILQACDCAMYLSKGFLVNSGHPISIMNQYEEDLFEGSKIADLKSVNPDDKKEKESLGFDITSVFFRNSKDEVVDSPLSSESTKLCVAYEASEESKIDKVYLSFAIQEVGADGFVLRLSSFDDDIALSVYPGRHELQVSFPYLGLKAGVYSMQIYAKKDSIYVFDFFESFRFKVRPKGSMVSCQFYQPRNWHSIIVE